MTGVALLFRGQKKNESIGGLSNIDDPRYMREDMAEDIEDQEKRVREAVSRMTGRMGENRQNKRPRPDAMGYFDDLSAYPSNRISELKKFKEKGGKVVGTLCVFVPTELIRAAGAVSVRLCSGHYESVHPANELLGDAGLCPLVKSTLGNRMVRSDPYFELCDLVVAPATCDGKMKLGEILADLVPVVLLNVPRIKSGDTNSRVWFEEMKYLANRLEDLTGRKITRKAIRKAIGSSNSAGTAWRELMGTRKEPRVSLWGADMILVSQLALMDDPDRWSEHVRKLTAEVREMQNRKKWVGTKDSPRVLLAGSPVIWPNWKIPNLVEESDGIIVADELCSSARLLEDPIVIDELTRSSMIRAIAERYLFPCTCPCFSPNDERVQRMSNRIDEYALDGLVFHVLRGCHLNNLEASRIELFMRKRLVSMLKIETEYDEGDVEQLRTRIEAFFEMIKTRKEFLREGKGRVEKVEGFDADRLEAMKGEAEGTYKKGKGRKGQKGRKDRRSTDKYALGIDVGALYTKMVLVRGGKVIDRSMESTTMDPGTLAGEMLERMLERNGIDRGKLRGIMATGQGKGSLDLADGGTTEISAFATGGREIIPDVRMVIDVGGQGIRVSELDEEGIITSFRTNDKCSSGTGTFLDTMAASLGVDPEEMGPLGCNADCPSCVVATCTVFAESEMVSLVAKKVNRKNIIGGLNRMVAKKISAVAKSLGVKGDVMLAGGVALNENVVDELRKRLKHRVEIPEHPEYVGALGAALMAVSGGKADE